MAWSGLDGGCVRRHFSRMAGHYSQRSAVAQAVNQRLGEHLLGLDISPAVIVDIGAGTGDGQPILQKQFPSARRYALDFAWPMLSQARESVAWWRRWRSHQSPLSLSVADMHALPLPNHSVDLVWSSLALQWVEDLSQVCAEVWRILKPGGLFICATLGPDTLQEIRWAFDGLDDYPHTSAFLPAPDWVGLLMSHHFHSLVMDIDQMVVRYPTLTALFKELHESGATLAMKTRRRTLMGKGIWQRMCARYETLKEEDGRYPLRYEVLYAHAWKPTQSPHKPLALPHQPIRFYPRVSPSA